MKTGKILPYFTKEYAPDDEGNDSPTQLRQLIRVTSNGLRVNRMICSFNGSDIYR